MLYSKKKTVMVGLALYYLEGFDGIQYNFFSFVFLKFSCGGIFFISYGCNGYSLKNILYYMPQMTLIIDFPCHL